MTKIQKRFLILFAALTFSKVALAQPDLWPAGENICEGGWQYEQLQACELPGSIVDGAVASGSCVDLVEDYRTYQSCRVAITDPTLGCGPETYKFCKTMNCEGSIWGEFYDLRKPNSTCDIDFINCRRGDTVENCYTSGRDAIVQCKQPDQAATCRDPSCPVETWKECRHSSCPVEKVYYKCNRWSSGYADSCGAASKKITDPRTLKPGNVVADGRRIKDFYALGSACLTCDDIPMDSTEHIRQRFECLAKGIDLAEAQSPGYSFKTTLTIINQLQGFGVTFSSHLNPEQTARLAAILSKYSIGG